MSIFLTINTRPSMKIGVIVASILFLLYAILTPQKYGFYILLRVFIFSGMLYLAKVSHEENREFFLYRFLIIALVYNPIIRLPLGKDWWIIINILTIAFLSHALIKYISDQNKEARLKNNNQKNTERNISHSPLNTIHNGIVIRENYNDIEIVENYNINDSSLNELNEKIAHKNIKPQAFKEGLARVKVENKIYFITTSGELIAKESYEDASDFCEGYAVVRKDNKYGFINKKGELVIDFTYQKAEPFKDGLAKIKVKNKYGFINKSGELIIEPLYKNAQSFNEGLASVLINGKYGYINKRNEIVIPPIFENAGGFQEGRALINKIDKLLSKLNDYDVMAWSYIDKKGKYRIKRRIFVDLQIEQDPFSEGFSEGLTRYRAYSTINAFSDKQYGFIDKNGRVVIKAIFDYASKFSDGLAYVEYGSRRGYLNRKGEFEILNYITLPPNRRQDISDKYIKISKDCQIYNVDKNYTTYLDLINKDDEELKNSSIIDYKINPRGNEKRNLSIYNFSEGLACVEYGSRKGYINQKGCFVIAPIFTKASPFSEGIALVRLNGRNQYIKNPLKKQFHLTFEKNVLV